MKRLIMIIFLYMNILLFSTGKQFTLYITNRAYYSKYDKVMCITHKATNVNDNVYYLLHEYGHYISNLLVGDDNSKEEFIKLLEVYKDKYKNRTSRFSIDYSTSELKDYRKSPIQDIINGITRGGIRYIFKHDTSYWTDDNIYQEVFANLYLLYVVGDQKQINEIDKIFPGLMKSFANMINRNYLKFDNIE